MIADSCDDLNVCTNNLCVDFLCNYQFVDNGPVTGCTGTTGCDTPPCGCVNGRCNNYCTLDSECDDSNPCTADTCTGNTCVNTIRVDGQYSGCTGTTGCVGSVCACISGTCTNTCGNTICQSPWETYLACPADCPASCEDNPLTCSGTYFYGVISTENEAVCACCGDDLNEYFYNGSLSTTNYICHNSALVNSIDNNQNVCEYYNYAWLNAEETNLIGDWRLNEGAGDIAGDELGISDGVLTGSPLWVDGHEGSALYFSGSNSLVADLNYDVDAVTVSLWINLTGYTAGYNFFQLLDGDNNLRMLIQVQNGNTLFFQCFQAPFTGGGNWQYSIPLNQWVHVAFSCNNTAITAYMDGVVDGISSGNLGAATPLREMRAPGDGVGKLGFKAEIDDIKIFNYSLTPSELSNVYQGLDYSHQVNSSCCGDDGINDDFYTGLLSLSSNFCINGGYYETTLDSNKTLCESYSNKWVSNVNHAISFTNDAEGTVLPAGLEYGVLMGETLEHTNITTSVLDYYEGRFKVLKYIFNGSVDGPPEILTFNETVFFNSGTATIDFWSLINDNYGECGGSRANLVFMLVNSEEMSDGEPDVLYTLELTNYSLSFYNGSHTYEYDFNNNDWANYRLTINKDSGDISYYANNELIDTVNNFYDKPFDLLWFYAGGNNCSNVYLDSINFNISKGAANCCGDDDNELFGNRTHYCSADTITPYTGAWYTGCSLGSTVVNLDNGRGFNRDDLLVCGCNSELEFSTINNYNFNNNLTDWETSVNSGNYLAVTEDNYASSPYSLYLQSNNPSLEPQVSASTNFNYKSGQLTLSYYGHINTSEWMETQPAGPITQEWKTASINKDGEYMLAGVYTGRLYKSSDNGNSWSEIRPHTLDEPRNWFVSEMDTNGQFIMAGIEQGRLYWSSDNGNSWSEIRPHTLDEDLNWRTIAMNEFGTINIAGVYGGRLYLGAENSWTEIRPHGLNENRNWQASAISYDGNTLFAAAYGDRLYNSSDIGVTWTETGPSIGVNKNWNTISMSSDGSIIIAGVYNGRLYKSTDGGITWSETGPTIGSDKTWTKSSMSSDGSKIIVTDEVRLYYSTDSGITWPETRPAGDVDKLWTSLAISDDGNTLISGVAGGAGTGGPLYIRPDMISFAGVMVGPDDGNALYYVLFNNGVNNAGYCCPDFSTGCSNTCGANIGGNSYIYCLDMTPFTQNAWNTITLNISDDFMECNGLNINNTELGLSAALFGKTNAYFDDFIIRPTTDGHYCDAGNNEGLADGVCYAGACVKPYINSFDGEFLLGDNVIINTSFVNFTQMTSCTLNFDGVDYPMTINGNRVTSELSTYPVSTYTATITCTEQVGSFSRTASIDIIHWADAEILFSNCNQYSISAYDNNVHMICRAYSGIMNYLNSSDYGANWGSAFTGLGYGDYPTINTNFNTLHVLSISGTTLSYSKSTNNGATWAGQSMTSIISGATTFALDSNNEVHSVWGDDRVGNREIYYKNTTNFGATFNSDYRLTTDSAWSDQPSISVEGTNIHVVWIDTRTGGNQNVYYKRSTDNGATWGSDQSLSTIVTDHPKITASGDNIHVIWRDSSSGNLYYKNSSNNGVSWNNDYALVTDSVNNPVISASGSNVYVAWSFQDGRTQIYFKYSTDNGATWSETEQISTTTDFSSGNPAITSYGASVYLIWGGNERIYFRKGKF